MEFWPYDPIPQSLYRKKEKLYGFPVCYSYIQKIKKPAAEPSMFPLPNQPVFACMCHFTVFVYFYASKKGNMAWGKPSPSTEGPA